jgi:8-oxo-dGTP pyrophosphatase MutT (NUDIX family)
MSKFKEGKNEEGKVTHYSVGAVIERDGKYLLIDRVLPPFGFAGIAGHVDEGGEGPEETLVREVMEEAGLKVLKYELLFEEELKNNICVAGVDIHYWRVYKCEVLGEVRQNKEETKSIGWYTKEEIKNLNLELAWQYWFKKLGVA